MYVRTYMNILDADFLASGAQVRGAVSHPGPLPHAAVRGSSRVRALPAPQGLRMCVCHVA